MLDEINAAIELVYAELALMQQTGLLNGSQYQAALHNIQAIQSLAETAVAGIGQTAGAAAEKMALAEELAELQKDLADFQADHAMDVTEDAFDKQYEAYEQERDAEIEKLEESISSTQKLYDMAIKYIKENWSTLYQELVDWNYEYGSNLNSEITAAWEAAQGAASRYGDFVTAIMGGIESNIANITRLSQSLCKPPMWCSIGAPHWRF